MNIFEQASRDKLRFSTPKGLATVEDLWDLPLITKNGGACLDNIAKGLHRTLKESDTESFVVKATKPNEELQLKFDVVKHIIDVRLVEADKAEQARAHREKKQRIMAIIADKEDKALADMDVESLRKLMEDY